MCIYIQQMPLCGHPPPTLLSYTNCGAVLAQLDRIAEPDAWRPENAHKIPFDLPDDCDPRPGENVWTLYSDDYCGWECRNNAFLLLSRELEGAGFGGGPGGVGGGFLPAYMPGDEKGQCVFGRGGGYLGGSDQVDRRGPMVLGMPDARYGPGSERLGIGWQSA